MPHWASPQVWFTAVTSVDTEEPSSRGGISPRAELSCLRCCYAVCKECAGCWGGSFVGRGFEGVILRQAKVFRGCLLWCHPFPWLSSPAVLVLMSWAHGQLGCHLPLSKPPRCQHTARAAWTGVLFGGCPNLSEGCKKFGCCTRWDLEFAWGFS